MLTAEQQLAGFIAKFAQPNQRLIRAVRKSLRAWVPEAYELVYDNYNFLVVAYCPSVKISDSYFSFGADKNGVSLFFGYNGTKLDDPAGLLLGKGVHNRFVRLESAESLERPGVRALVMAAIELSGPSKTTRGELIIRSVSPKQRPRK